MKTNFLLRLIVLPAAIFASALHATEPSALSAQLTAQPAHPLRPVGTDHFAITSVAAEISFERDAGRRVTALVLHQNGRDQRAPRTPEISLTSEKLCDYVGHYPLSEHDQPGFWEERGYSNTATKMVANGACSKGPPLNKPPLVASA